MKPTPWIIVNDGTKGRDAYMLHCLRCGAVQRFELPISIDYFVNVGKAFQKEHGKCRERGTQKWRSCNLVDVVGLHGRI